MRSHGASTVPIRTGERSASGSGITHDRLEEELRHVTTAAKSLRGKNIAAVWNSTDAALRWPPDPVREFIATLVGKRGDQVLRSTAERTQCGQPERLGFTAMRQRVRMAGRYPARKGALKAAT